MDQKKLFVVPMFMTAVADHEDKVDERIAALQALALKHGFSLYQDEVLPAVAVEGDPDELEIHTVVAHAPPLQKALGLFSAIEDRLEGTFNPEEDSHAEAAYRLAKQGQLAMYAIGDQNSSKFQVALVARDIQVTAASLAEAEQYARADARDCRDQWNWEIKGEPSPEPGLDVTTRDEAESLLDFSVTCTNRPEEGVEGLYTFSTKPSITSGTARWATTNTTTRTMSAPPTGRSQPKRRPTATLPTTSRTPVEAAPTIQARPRYRLMPFLQGHREWDPFLLPPFVRGDLT